MLSNLRIGTRLFILGVFQCVLLAGISLVGLSGAAQTKDRLHGAYEESIVPLLYLDTLLDDNFQARAQLQQALAAENPAEAQKHLDRIAGFTAEAEKTWKSYAATAMNAEEKALAEETAQAQQALIAARQQVVDTLRSHGRAAAVEADKQVDLVAKFDRWRADLNKLVEHQARDAEVGKQEADGNSARVELAVIAALLFGIAVAAVVSWLAIRSITQPLAVERIVQMSEENGGTVTRTAQASHSLEALASALQKTVGSVRV